MNIKELNTKNITLHDGFVDSFDKPVAEAFVGC